MSCPTAEELLELAGGGLTSPQVAALELHLDRCPDCRTALSSAIQGDAPRQVGRYQLGSVLGAGGMGIVHQAYDPRLARAVAIKVVHGADDAPGGQVRLLREAQALARINHANVCQIHDVGVDGAEVWIAMELVEGVTLRQWADGGRDRATVLAALLDAGAGLAAAHAAGVVHRDVKADNVLVTGAGRVIVTDFGLAQAPRPTAPDRAHAADREADAPAPRPTGSTVTGAIVGTPAYLAAEQLVGGPVDARTDQFAWAVMAWELLTGVRPFPVEPVARLAAITAGPPRSSRLPRAIAAPLTRAMALVPDARFASMAELLAALRRRSRGGRGWRVAAMGVAAIAATVVWQAPRPSTRPDRDPSMSPNPSRNPTPNPTPNPNPNPSPSPFRPRRCGRRSRRTLRSRCDRRRTGRAGRRARRGWWARRRYRAPGGRGGCRPDRRRA